MLNRSVGIQELAAHGSDVRVSIRIRDQGIEPARFGDRVVVQEEDVFGLGCGCAGVTGGRKSSIPLQTNAVHGVPVAREQIRSGVGGGIVDDQQLEGDCWWVGEDGVQALLREACLVVDWDDDRAAWVRHHAPSLARKRQLSDSSTIVIPRLSCPSSHGNGAHHAARPIVERTPTAP